MAYANATLTMSLSRARRIEQCERQDWWFTEGAREGWRRDASPDARLAFALKKPTTLAGVVGMALHEAAKLYITALRDGRRPPAYEQLHDRVRMRLNEAVLNRNVEAWLDDPSGPPMLHEVYALRISAKSITHFGPSRSPISVQVDHAFRSKSALRSIW